MINKRNQRLVNVIFLLSRVITTEILGSCNNISNNNDNTETESSLQNEEQLLGRDTYPTNENGSTETFVPTKKISEIQQIAKDPNLRTALNNFKIAFNNIELKADEKYIELTKAVSNGVKLGIFSEHFEKILNGNQIHNSSDLIENILSLEQIMEKIDDSTYTDQERLSEIQCLIIRANISFQIIENIVNENNSAPHPTIEEAELIQQKSTELKELLIYKETTNFSKKNDYADITDIKNIDLEKFLFGNTKPIDLRNIEESSPLFKAIISSKDQSVISHWIQSKTLRKGTWDSMLNITKDENKITCICEDLLNLFQIYKFTNPESNIEDLQTNHKDFTSTLEKGESAIENLRKILKNTDTFTDISDNSDRNGLRWVGRWRKNGIEKQISTDEAVQLYAILDWMSAMTISIKYKKSLNIPIMNYETLLNTISKKNLLIKESDYYRKYRKGKELDSITETDIILGVLSVICFPLVIVWLPYLGYNIYKSYDYNHTV